MNQEPVPTTSPPAGEQGFQGPLRAWEVAFLVALSALLLLAAVGESRKEYYGNDELCTAILVSNPSFPAMWNTIRHGGELNPPLFFVLEWGVAQVFGPGELALRALSMGSMVLAGWVLFFTLRRLTGPTLAALAVALIFGLSRTVFMYACQARYYGLLFLLVSLGVWWALRLHGAGRLRRRDYVLVFLTHLALVYVHLYGGFFSAALLAGMIGMDWLHGKLRWSLYGCVLAAWAAFGAWVPCMLQQLKSVSGGVWLPPGYNTLGFFAEELALQIPLALVFGLLLFLGALAFMARWPARLAQELKACAAQTDWAAPALLALALLAVPVATWVMSLASPGLFMQRYIFPCTAAWVLLLALVLAGMFRLPETAGPGRARLSPRFWSLGWFGVLAFCLLFQPLRARKNPARAGEPFVDDDYGYKDLPMVFEDSWYFLPRVFYGKDRPYMLVTDVEAGEADPGWYTKGMVRFFRAWYPRYHRARIVHYEELPREFLAVDDDYTKTFEWLFQHRPDLHARLLGTRPLEMKEHGQQRVYLVQRVPAEK